MKKILLVTIACAGLCACSSDDIDLGSGTQKVFEGNQAYMTVRLCDVSSSTRATSSGWENGVTATETKVNDASFYFYDADGEYVSKGEVWNDGTAVSGNGNVEFKSNTEVILKDLKNKDYPKYVVTVLNKPANFVEPVYGSNTLDDMIGLLADESGVGIMQNESEKSGFTMSTSSYYDDTKDASNNLIRDYDFVTLVDESNFSDEPVADDLSTLTNAVDIYVERLASKVTVSVGDLDNKKTISTTDAADGNEHTVYAVQEAVAGDDGNGDVYVELEGWKLNATAKHSNIVKTIDDEWTNNGDNAAKDLGSGWTWNDTENFRSYWGKSFNYGIDGNYPTSSSDGTTNQYLTYVTLADGTLNSMEGSDYCAENTNTVDKIGTSKYSTAITSVLLRAKVCDETGNALDMVRDGNGLLYTTSAYIDHILSYLQSAGQLNVYYKPEEAEEVYNQIDASCVKLLDNSDGKATLGLDFDSETASTYYEYVYNEDEQKYEYNQISSESDYVISDAEVNAYNGGEMYYTIPIEHLNNNYGDVLQEANYGIVRNHHYVVTISSLEHLGMGIFDPEQIVVPNPDEEEDLVNTAYYIGADIQILSWKLVEQTVDL